VRQEDLDSGCLFGNCLQRTKAFDPPLIHEEEIEHSATGDEDKVTEEEGESLDG
jgi:hypothetical protein